jgi:hypothetical protein
MTTRRPGRRDPLEAAIEVALQPGRFIPSRGSFDFVSSLEEIAGQLDALVRTDARRAVALYETFLAGGYENAEELDDSGGNFSMFVVSLYCGWIRARQAASAELKTSVSRPTSSRGADDTARLTLTLVAMALSPWLVRVTGASGTREPSGPARYTSGASCSPGRPPRGS